MNVAEELAGRRLMPTYRRMPVTFVRGEGVYLYDIQGRAYLDFVAGIAVNVLGHSHPAVLEALAVQSSRVIHTSNFYCTEPMGLLADRLCELLQWPDGRVFFANSGAEAVECAIKLVRKWSRKNFGDHRHGTVAAQGSFHGRTFGALAATGQPEKRNAFEPLTPGFVHVPYDDPAAMKAAVTDATCSVLLEPIQGEAGILVPSNSYLPSVRKICDAASLAFVADEVQTGIGRTGRWFGFQSSGAVPDVVTLAKALGGGLPIGACVASGELATAFEPGDHASTMGGNALVCTTALAVLATIEQDGLLAKVEKTGRHLLGRLQDLSTRHEVAVEARGRGLLLALELSRPIAASIAAAAMRQGLLVNDVTPSVIRLCPPLVVTSDQCDEAVAILDEVLAA